MTSSKNSDGLATLQASILSTNTLIKGFQLALQSPTPPHPDIKNPPQPLALLSDSCKILKAQTTKLSLLMLNKPFTPSAITYVLNDCCKGCLPAMMSALELCPAEKYTHLLHKQVTSSLSRITAELLILIACLPQDERGIEPQSRDTLASTGVLWAECDKMVKLSADGIVSFAAQKVEEYHALLKDAIAELEDWDPEDDGSESDTDADSVSSSKPTTRHATTTTPSSSIPSLKNLSISPIVELRKRSLAILRTVRVLYPALQKRRIATFPNINSSTSGQDLPSSSNIEHLDAIVTYTQGFTEDADEIAGVLYENDEAQVNRRLKDLRDRSEQCAGKSEKAWRGEEDEFAGWLDKWLTRLKEVGEGK